MNRFSPVTEALKSARDFLQDKSFQPPCDDDRCSAIVDQIDAALASVAQTSLDTAALIEKIIDENAVIKHFDDGVSDIINAADLAKTILDVVAPNATPANRSTATATAIVGDDRQSMGSEPAMGIVTGGSDPTPLSSTNHGSEIPPIGKSHEIPMPKGFSLIDDGRICRDDDPDCRHPLCDCARYIAEQRTTVSFNNQREEK